jgi:carbonic anhydrase
MKNMKIQFAFLFVLVLGLAACDTGADKGKSTENEQIQAQAASLVGDVITREEQAALTPDQVIEELKAGNQRYVNNEITARDLPSQVKQAVSGQFPEAIILSCVDSRVPVEYVFDRGVGDVFVARVAGNFVNEDILGSMEFACKVSGSKVILVLGHEHCGAVKAAIDDVDLGNITPMIAKIKPAIDAVEYEGERSSKNAEFVQKVCDSNVRHTIEEIRTKSPILKEMEANGEIRIVGATYDLDTGAVSFEI